MCKSVKIPGLEKIKYENGLMWICAVHCVNEMVYD
jgi:hypothetical protein